MQNDIKNEERLSKEAILHYVQQMKDDKSVFEYTKSYDALYDYLSTTYAEMNDRYPGIVKMFANDATEGVEFDMDRLEKMLTMLDMMNVSERKPEVVTDTNVNLMKELRNEYVLPKLGMTQEDVNEVDPEKYKDVDWDKTNIKFNAAN
jgi:DNA repair ATPase RecN